MAPSRSSSPTPRPLKAPPLPEWPRWLDEGRTRCWKSPHRAAAYWDAARAVLTVEPLTKAKDKALRHILMYIPPPVAQFPDVVALVARYDTALGGGRDAGEDRWGCLALAPAAARHPTSVDDARRALAHLEAQHVHTPRDQRPWGGPIGWLMGAAHLGRVLELVPDPDPADAARAWALEGAIVAEIAQTSDRDYIQHLTLNPPPPPVGAPRDWSPWVRRVVADATAAGQTDRSTRPLTPWLRMAVSLTAQPVTHQLAEELAASLLDQGAWAPLTDPTLIRAGLGAPVRGIRELTMRHLAPDVKTAAPAAPDESRVRRPSPRGR